MVSPAVNLVVDNSDDQAFVQGDPGQIREVLVNLLENAVEAIGERKGEVRITSSTLSLTDRDMPRWSLAGLNITPGRYVILEVKDNGCGVAPEFISKVFDLFYTTKFFGRGLGLSAVLGIVRRHQGGVCFDSTPRVGTTVSVALPVGLPSALVTASKNITKRSGTVLMIDGDTFVQEFVTDVLKMQGMKVMIPSDIEHSVELFRQRQQDIALVLIDIDMPEIDSLAVISRMCEISSDTAIVVVSGHSELEALRATGMETVSGFIQKPYTSGTLLREVRKVVAP